MVKKCAISQKKIVYYIYKRSAVKDVNTEKEIKKCMQKE